MVVFAVGVDGSNVCYRAVEAVKCLADPARDIVYAIHVATKDKNDHGALIKVKAEGVLTSGLNPIDMEWRDVTKKEKESTMKALCREALEVDAGFLAIGAYGRKGERLEEMGHVAQGSLRRLPHTTGIVVKNSSRIPECGKARAFLIATDFSENATAAFLYTLEVLARPGDRVIVLFVTCGIESFVAPIRHFHLEKLRNSSVQGQFEAVEANGRSLATVILDAAYEFLVDFIVCGHVGSGVTDESSLSPGADLPFGSVSQQVKEGAHCTVIVFKPPKTMD